MVLVLLAGCPPKGAKQTPPTPPAPTPTEDKFDRFGQVLGNEDAFYYELKRLQGLHTSPPSFSGISLGNASHQFSLSSRIEDERIGFVVADTQSGEEWVLWAWDRKGESPEKMEIIKDTPTANGHAIELSFSQNSLALSLVARWDHGRFLVVSRELMLGGLDHDWRVPASSARWQVEGRWLPYRMVPGIAGPYGVVLDAEADGAWHERHYPETSMVPAVAAFDRYHGVLLCIVDEHPRKLDRTYSLSWKVADDYSYGPVIGIAHQQYDSISDVYNETYLVSGLPYRDRVVLALFKLDSQSMDTTLVEAETTEVIGELSAITRAYHLAADPPELADPGCIIDLSDWLTDEDTQVKFVHKARDSWNVVGSLFSLGELLPTTPPPAKDTTLSRLPGVREWETEGSAGYVSAASILGELQATQSYPPWPDLRSVQTAATISRGLADAVGELAGNYGISFDNPIQTGLLSASEPAPIRFCSSEVAAALTTAFVAEQLAEDGRPCSIAGGLALGVPVANAVYRLVDPVFGSGEHGVVDTKLIIPSNRLASFVCKSIFGVRPLVDCPQGGLAAQVIATTPVVSGHFIGKQLEMYYGFEEFANHQPELRYSAGEMQVIHSSPESSGYLSGGERPAQFEELVIVMPGDLQGSGAVWIAFFGTGGSVTVDEYNFVTVNWGDFGYWRDKLPVGYWVVMHPDPENIVAGDAVLILRTPIQPGSPLGVTQG